MIPSVTKRCAVALLMLFVASTSSFGAECDETIQLGAWNIEWLGDPGSRSGPAENFAQLPSEVATYIRHACVDALALEEIGIDFVDRAGRPRNRTLDQTFRLLNQQARNNRDYRLFFKRKEQDESQLTGFAWNKRKLSLVGNPMRVNFNFQGEVTDRAWDRSATAVKVSAGGEKSDLVLIPLHMKSNRGGQKTIRQREAEARMLVEALPEVRQTFADDDLILLGDTNVKHGGEGAMTVFESAGFLDLNATDLPTTYQGSAPFDRVLVTGEEEEFVDSNFAVVHHPIFSPERFKVRLSDHYLVTATVCIAEDDD